jgi:hypothetical protein
MSHPQMFRLQMSACRLGTQAILAINNQQFLLIITKASHSLGHSRLRLY